MYGIKGEFGIKEVLYVGHGIGCPFHIVTYFDN